MEPGGSLSCSLESVTDPNSEPEESRWHHNISYLFKTHFNIIFQFKSGSAKYYFLMKYSYQNFVCISLLSHAYYKPRLYNSPL